MLLRTLLLLFFTFPLVSLSCSRDREPEPTPSDGTFTVSGTGGLTFNVSGDTKSGLVYYAAKKKLC